jgi:hypothetical protein
MNENRYAQVWKTVTITSRTLKRALKYHALIAKEEQKA